MEATSVVSAHRRVNYRGGISTMMLMLAMVASTVAVLLLWEQFASSPTFASSRDSSPVDHVRLSPLAEITQPGSDLEDLAKSFDSRPSPQNTGNEKKTKASDTSNSERDVSSSEVGTDLQETETDLPQQQQDMKGIIVTTTLAEAEDKSTTDMIPTTKNETESSTEKSNMKSMQLDTQNNNTAHAEVMLDEKSIQLVDKRKEGCDYTVGKWVMDKSHPLYSGRECTMWLSPDWACRLHNHPDKHMDRYRWQPASCNLPVFNASNALEMLRNKVVAFVGDSLGRQQYQSLLCMLTHGKNATAISDAASKFNFYTPRGSRRPTGWAHRFDATNTTLIFKWTVTLAQVEPLKNKTLNALHLDRPEAFLSDHLHNLDVIILNSGHHWNNGKMEQNGYKFYTNGKPATETSVAAAYNQTIHNVVTWIHEKTRKSRKKVYYRSLSPRHFRNGDWNTGGTCDTIRFEEGKQEIMERDVNAESAVMGTSVGFLNITALSTRRGETHVSKYGRDKGGQDCLHWCLPGVPDTWNEILLAELAASSARYGNIPLLGPHVREDGPPFESFEDVKALTL